MEFPRLLLLSCLLVAVWVLVADAAAARRRPGCATSSTARPWDSKAWVKTPIYRQCYDQATNRIFHHSNKWMKLASHYVLSRDDNKVTVYTIGCTATCEALKNGSCSRTVECCQMSLPKAVRNYEVNFNGELYNTTQIWGTAPCNYITVMEKASFKFSTTYLTSGAFYDKDHARAPVVVEWAIAQRNTCEARIDKTLQYACVSRNSICIRNDAGYACNCSAGYQGNPYIADGCKDIDECLNVTACAGICTNTLGSFTCSCPWGKTMIGNVCVKDNQKSIWIPVVGTSLFILVLGLGGPFIMRKIKLHKVKKMKQRFFNQNHGLLLQQLISHNSDIGERMIITLREIEKATDNFDRARVVGGGGHGIVFKGILDLHVVAIKKSKIVVQREIDEFINEVAVLSQVNHRNVVKLLGCCLETEVPLLVYEFISNGTLYNHLHVDGTISILWVDRLRIALEVARALSYLHSAASMPIFHRDIKSSNILLDNSLTAKVSDFGASRYIPIDQIGVTTVVQGTLGYLDPMYHYTGRLTDKSDVFSFGVLLIELLTRKKPSIYRSDDGDNLVSHFEKMLATSNLIGIIDPQAMDEENGDLQEVATLAVICTKLRGEDRPTMREVEMKLENLVGKNKLVPCTTTPRRNDGDEAQVQYLSIEPATKESSRQYTMEREIQLSSSYPR
ncbi:unnamed protein product [Urochloa decumbens]|uniref:Protein kinase domain-containing protein n=1 Tax=Urochloa decumbens TaxID=240449 RepID=A0ABC9BPB0_9POAL